MRISPGFGLAAILLGAWPAQAQEQMQGNFRDWPVLKNPFESTSGGGIMIDGYDPVVAGNVCRTDFTARTPAGEVFHNSIEFEAIAVAGGILCTNGRWRAKDGSAQGTTPFRVFIADGVVRRSP